MQLKTLQLVGSVALLTASFTSAHAGKTTHFTDYARVTHVEPRYSYSTVREPQRHCEFVRPQNNNRHSNHPTRQQRRDRGRQFVSGESYGNTGVYQVERQNRDSGSNASAVIVGGVFGGAVGHHLGVRANGKSDPALTLAGAAIGSAIANTAANKQKKKNKNYLHHTDGQERHTDSGQYRLSHNNNRGNGRGNRHGHDRQRGYERCVTTTTQREVRQLDGYNVTYVYRGNTFRTRTTQHPGEQIRVRVQIKPH